jgi:hypothetical protein
MSAKQEQSAAPEGIAIAIAVTSLAGAIAPALDLSPLDDSETPEAHALRLLGALHPVAEAVATENASLRRQLAAQKGQVTKARKEVAALEAALPPEPRQFTVPADRVPGAYLMELIAEAVLVELVFVDRDARELERVPARIMEEPKTELLSGDRVHIKLADVRVANPSDATAPLDMAGYALLLDDDLVAVAFRSEPLAIRPGTAMQLAGDVIL